MKIILRLIVVAGAITAYSFWQGTAPAEASVEGETIAIDAGHGGYDSGATGNGVYEKELVNDVAVRTKERLEQGGANVIMTRSGDNFVELKERARIANEAGADAFVSIHANSASTASADGSETYYYPQSSEGSELASGLQTNMVNEFNSNDRGIKSANFSVLRNTAMPAALVELGFVSNKEEAADMQTSAFRNEAANAIYLGLSEYH
ncbi:N-acetylmuramoyl-L-alanine amidase [uncultured Marinococcus sp.]|jgi:N-acetylmuramoyl-L-alanine amidase|uniref:N-acetylmuramoyl-L-alanine amidase family protein n=1 Tax=uncultured Marinococcus sp. TaxID=487012 RepID=UPI00262F40EE|nr:N-acetylmuramoyl-L-alanine amidase [uncultured Marinococcus sp.]